MAKVGEIWRAAGEVAYKMWRTSRLRPGANAFVEEPFMKIPNFSVTSILIYFSWSY